MMKNTKTTASNTITVAKPSTAADKEAKPTIKKSRPPANAFGRSFSDRAAPITNATGRGADVR
jgi:hypothetical protein